MHRGPRTLSITIDANLDCAFVENGLILVSQFFVFEGGSPLRHLWLMAKMKHSLFHFSGYLCNRLWWCRRFDSTQVLFQVSDSRLQSGLQTLLADLFTVVLHWSIFEDSSWVVWQVWSIICNLTNTIKEMKEFGSILTALEQTQNPYWSPTTYYRGLVACFGMNSLLSSSSGFEGIQEHFFPFS